MKKKIVVAFDFDGTITNNDTFIDFIIYSKGIWSFCWGFFLYSPLLIAFKLGLYSNWKLKQKIFSYYFRGMSINYFDEICRSYFSYKRETILRKRACEAIQKYKEEGCLLIIVSASIENWILPFSSYLGIDKVLATQIEVNEKGILTGKFKSNNCYGKEKVLRLQMLLRDRSSYKLIAFGDSRGDKELLSFADNAFYKEF